MLNFKEKIKIVNETTNGEYTLLEQTSDKYFRCRFRHNICGKEFLMTFSDFKRGRRCPHCFGSPKKTTESFKQEVFEKVGEEYSVLSEYKGTNEKVLMRHNVCGNEYYVTPSKFLSLNRRCSRCARNEKLNNETFMERLNKIYPNEFQLKSDYTSIHSPIRLLHCCGKEDQYVPHDILLGRTYCKACKEKIGSIGEKRVEKLLTENDIPFDSQFIFSEEIRGEVKPHRFDFFLKEKNLIIEFDGEQHFRPSFKREDTKSFLWNIETDSEQNSFLINNKINCIRIKYTQNKSFKLSEVIENIDNFETLKQMKYLLLIEDGKLFNEEVYYSERERNLKKISK